MVARVCAQLVAAGEPPADLFVAMPNLEDAVVALLSGEPGRNGLGEVALWAA